MDYGVNIIYTQGCRQTIMFPLESVKLLLHYYEITLLTYKNKLISAYNRISVNMCGIQINELKIVHKNTLYKKVLPFIEVQNYKIFE